MANPLNFRSFSKFLERNKLYTAINVFGLSVSLMFVILIAVYTTRELSVDKFHANRDRIYALGNENYFGSGYGLAPHLLNRYPEIEKITATAQEHGTVEVMDTRYSVNVLLVDSTFYDIFSFRMIEGDPGAILRTTTDAILTEEFAHKVFGDADPLGQMLKFDDEFSVVVAGVAENFRNTSFPESDIIMNMENMEEHFNGGISNQHMNNAGGVVFFIMTYPEADLVSKIPDMKEYFKEIFWVYARDIVSEVVLTPLDEFYFSQLEASTGDLGKGDRTLVMILISVGALILIFAIINYINLTVAQTGFRAKEMASRRLLGASRGEIFSKFILESIIVCAFAFAVGFMLALALQNVTGDLLQRRLDVMGSLTYVSGGIYIATIALIGAISGIIPAVFISRYKPIDVVKGSFRHKSKMVFSKVFIVFQNVITISLIAASFTMLLQMRHMIEAPMGYNYENIIDMPSTGFKSRDMIKTFKNELRQLASVKEVVATNGHPLNMGNNMTVEYRGKNVSFQTFHSDTAFFNMMGFEVLKDNNLADRNGYWINETARFELEMSDDDVDFKLGDQAVPVLGVVKNFRIGDVLNERASPALIYLIPENTDFWPWGFLIEVQGDPDAAFADVRGVYERLTDVEFEGKFLKDQIREAYDSQRRTYTIVTIFTLIAVLISMLGLLAMSTYFIQQRASEIAIRKVFGSTRREMLRRLVFNFLRLVLIALVLAIPVIWLLMRWWLSNYNYRIDLSPWIFVAAGALALIIAFVTVLWQSARAANANPIEAIKR